MPTVEQPTPKRYITQVRYAGECKYREDKAFHQSLDAFMRIGRVILTPDMVEARVYDTKNLRFIHYVGKPLDGTPE